jgi:uncharacterized membrane protein
VAAPVCRRLEGTPGQNGVVEETERPEGGHQDHSEGLEHLKDQLGRIERLVDPGLRLLQGVEERAVLPAWRRVTRGEPRWPVSVGIVAAVAMQASLPDRVATHPRWLLPGLAVVLLIGLISSNVHRIERRSPRLRAMSMALIAVMSLANAWSAARLVVGLIQGTMGKDATPLLLTGSAIWLTNVVVFCLWYWELDRGGPVARAAAVRSHPDFLFVQMQSPELAPYDWEPAFVDYLYLSFTNATAFSPTDVLPLSRWAKLMMMLQSVVSLVTVALVIARAVNILS